MSSSIVNEAKKHLYSFLIKVENGSWTSQERENFILMSYQTPDLEKIRVQVCQMISPLSADRNSTISVLSTEERASLRKMIDLLESQ